MPFRNLAPGGRAAPRGGRGPAKVDIHDTTKIAVVAKGRLQPRRELDRMLADVEAFNKKK